MNLYNNQKKINKLFGSEAFTLIELMVVLGILGILAAIGIAIISGTKKNAYDVVVKNDLKSFAKSEEIYFFDNNQFLGNPGQTTRNDGGTSDFILSDFTPSEGVSITVVSGDPFNPSDPTNPYIVQAMHILNSDNKFEYNFVTREITKK